jgi:hypothetical protein
MTIEEAIKRLKSDIYEYADFTENHNENEFWTAFDMAIKALEAPPNEYSKRLWKSAYERGKADAEQRWIPVSERLPELNQNVIVTYNKEDEFRVDISYYSKHGFWIGNVVAWMPLPEPMRLENK